MEKTIKFISPLNDMTIKTLWVKGSSDTKRYLNRFTSNVVGYDVSKYVLFSNELGLIDYKSIANKVDILLVSPDNKRKINVELNRNYSKYLSRKNDTYIYILAGNTYAGVKKEEKYKFAIDVEQININNYFNRENRNIAQNSYVLADRENNLIREGIKIHELYLPKIKEICYDSSNELYKDLAMFKAQSYEELEEIAKGDKEREAVVADLKKLGSDAEFVDYYDHDEFQEIRMMHELEDARNEGMAEGHAVGLIEERVSVINKMLSKGKTFEEISDLLDISVEKIQELINK